MAHFGIDPPETSLSTLGEETSGLSKTDRSLLSRNLYNMAEQVDRFHFALILYTIANESWVRIIDGPLDQLDRGELAKFAAWKACAARDCILAVADFRVSMDGANGILKGMKRDADGASPFSLYDSYFPGINKARNAAAHYTLPDKNQQQQAAHVSEEAMSDPNISIAAGSSVTITGTFIDNNYTMTFEGKIVSLAIDQLTLDRLEQVKAAFFRMLPLKTSNPKD